MEDPKEKYYLSEYFVSIQGEGNCAGINSLFIRFHFCNLTCTWCDTKYTWQEGSGRFEPYSDEQLKTLILSYSSQHVIFTGGEPTLYRLDKLVIPGKKYHVESNGTIIPTLPVDITIGKKRPIARDAMNEAIIRNFNWVISPKLSNSAQEINEEGLHFWAGKDYCIFKFIIRSVADINEIESVMARFSIPKNKVYLGMEGQSLESQLQPALVDEIVKRGFHFSPRLHVMLWGAKRRK